jgi:hypothetical protein
MDRLLPRLPAVTLTAAGLRRASHGNTLSSGDFVESSSSPSRDGAEASVRLRDDEGRLIAIAERRPGGLLHPSIVLV